MKNFLLFLLCFITLNGFTQQVVTYNFSLPQQVESGNGFSKLIIDNCSFINDEGEPDLPVFCASLLLEPGHEISHLHIRSVEFYPAIENINISPASANFPISKGAPAGYKAVSNPEIYNENKDYPENIFAGINTSFMRGYAIGTFLIYPVIYNPVQLRAKLIKTITLEVYTEPTSKATHALSFLRNDHKTIERVRQSTTNRNKTILDSYQSLNTRSDNPNFDILVITKEAFTTSLTNYIAHKNLWGYKVLVKTVEEIYDYYEGIDNAEKMRNCVIDAYQNDGISYLMLFGDSHQNSSSPHNIIPYRKLYASSGGETDNLPSDMYFACLDGTWNSGDGTWGKPGFDDLSHEISVGRICADNVGEIQNFVTKLIKYQETPVVVDTKKALMVGEMLNDNPLTWGGDCKDQIKTGGTYNGYTTVGFPSHIDVSTLYDKNGFWNKTQLLNHFNNLGVHIINHLGHSNVDYNLKLDNSDITNTKFTNDGTQRMLSIVYSQGCLNGAFDNTDGWGWDYGDCINEKFHKINGGVVANIGNSRYGWYNPGGTNGSSQRFDRYFFDGIFGKNIFTIGDANSYSKDINKGLVQYNANLRWCCYELNLMGDPSMDIWTDTPTEFDPFDITVVKVSNLEILVSTGVPFARVALLQNNELFSRGVCDSLGNATLYLDTPFDPAPITISISGHNKYRYQQTGMIFIDSPPIRDLTANVEENTVILDWREPDYLDDNAPDFYAIYRDGNKIKTLSSDFLSYQDEDQLGWNTNFDYCVKALYSVQASIPVCLPVKTDPYCDIVGGITSSVSGKAVALKWMIPEPIAPDNYSVYRDGVFIKETTKSIIIDVVPEDDTKYEYCVVAHYKDCEPEPVCVDVVVGSPISIKEIQAELFQIYPNPATNYVTVIGSTMQRIDVRDITGRIVCEVNPHGACQTNISVAELENGLYFLRIQTDENILVKRFTIIR